MGIRSSSSCAKIEKGDCVLAEVGIKAINYPNKKRINAFMLKKILQFFYRNRCCFLHIYGSSDVMEVNESVEIHNDLRKP